MAAQVFISYSRSTSTKHAHSLKNALGEDAFLDTSEIPFGAQFPRYLSDALTSAKVVVIFADRQYFHQLFCLHELRLALKAFEEVVRRPGTDQERRDALAGIIVAIPDEGIPEEFDLLPPLLRVVSWPTASDLGSLVKLVQERLIVSEPSGAPALILGVDLLEESLLPRVSDLGTVPTYPKNLGESQRGSFVGRADELWLLHFTFRIIRYLQSEDNSIAVALEGGGGVGKSQLAIEYLRRHGTFYQGGIFWIDAGVMPNGKGLAQLREDARASDLAEKIIRERRREAEQELRNTVSCATKDLPVLFVIDDVPETNPDSVESWCPAIPQAHLLITSRQRVSLASRTKLYSIPVHPLRNDSSIRLLSSNLPQAIATLDDWQTIASWVGHLPLALQILNRALSNASTTISRLVAKAKTNQPPAGAVDEVVEAARPAIPSAYGLTEALSYSFDLLPYEAKAAALRLACLSPAPIPSRLAEKLADPAALTILRHRSFIMPSWQHDIEMYGTLHPILADVIRNRNVSNRLRRWIFGHQSTLTQQKRKRALEAGAALCDILSPEAVRDHALWSTINACIPHIDWLLDQNAMRSTLVKVSDLAPLLMRTDDYFEQIDEQQEATRSLADIYRRLEKNHPGWVRDSWFIAKYLGLLSEPTPPKDLSSVRLDPYFAGYLLSEETVLEETREIIPGIEKRLRARIRFLGACDPGTLAVWSDLGFYLLFVHRYKDARDQLIKLLAACEDSLGTKHPIITVNAWNLVTALYFLQETEDARRTMTRYLHWLQSAPQEQLTDPQRRIRAELEPMEGLIEYMLST
jgi:hypothetical protein